MPKIYKFKNLDSAQATITELAKSLQTDDIILYTDSITIKNKIVTKLLEQYGEEGLKII